MVRLLSPLVVIVIVAVTGLSIARIILVPESWASSVAAFAFFPLVVGWLAIRSRSTTKTEKSGQIPGGLRSALVGAGVLLATSLLLSLSDHLGITGQMEERFGGPLLGMLGAVIAAAAEFLGARREQRRKNDPDQ